MKARLLILLMVLAGFSAVSAAPGALMVPVKFTIENGDFDKTTVAVYKNGNFSFSVPGQHNMRMRLEFGSEYLLAFNKPGYITKKIRINTIVPESRIKNGFAPYKIGVRIFKQYEGVNIVVYNQPVAYIRFHTELDEFAYDVDYTKSILSSLEIAEKELEASAERERQMIKLRVRTLPSPVKENPEPSTPSVVIEPPNSSNQTVIEPLEKNQVYSQPVPASAPQAAPSSPAPDSKTLATEVIEGYDSNKSAQVIHGEERRSSTAPLTGEDKEPTSGPVASGQEKEIAGAVNGEAESFNATAVHFKGKDPIRAMEKTVEAIQRTVQYTVEPNRTITTIKISQGSKLTEYRRVYYNWGGQFFFMNGTKSIPQSTFDFYNNAEIR